MIKLIMCLARRSDLSREEFQAYWKDDHGPFFMENAGIMRAKKYVQSHTITSPLNDGMRQSRGMLEEFDGVAEVWFESREAMDAVFDTPEGQRARASATGTASNIAILLTEEHLMVE